jgi:hypothetical protein
MPIVKLKHNLNNILGEAELFQDPNFIEIN